LINCIPVNRYQHFGSTSFLDIQGSTEHCCSEQYGSYLPNYEGHLESKEGFAIKKYLLIIGKKKNMQVLSHTFTYFST
jgi:hypothetical protein